MEPVIHSGFHEFPEIAKKHQATVNQSHPQQTKQPDSEFYFYNLAFGFDVFFSPSLLIVLTGNNKMYSIYTGTIV